MTRVVIVDLGSGNLRSVEKALVAVGAAPEVTSNPERIARAPALVLPGQGAFGEGMRAIRERGLEAPLRAAWARGVPTLGICLGLQLLFDASEEAPGVAGLGVIPGVVRRFVAAPAVKVPHMGWNDVSGSDALWAGGSQYVYFVHSYYCEPVAAAVTALTCDYAGVHFCAAARSGSIFAVQFHPEKSQRAGLDLLRRFVARCRVEQMAGFVCWGEAPAGRGRDLHDFSDGASQVVFDRTFPRDEDDWMFVFATLKETELALGRGPWAPGRPGWRLRARRGPSGAVHYTPQQLAVPKGVTIHEEAGAEKSLVTAMLAAGVPVEWDD